MLSTAVSNKISSLATFVATKKPHLELYVNLGVNSYGSKLVIDRTSF